jgi:hypothetical protein
MRTDVHVRRLHYGLVLHKVVVICLDPSGLCSTTGVPAGSMFNDGRAAGHTDFLTQARWESNPHPVAGRWWSRERL